MRDFVEEIRSKNDFLRFLDILANDFKTNNGEWENKNIPDFLEQMGSWLEDYSECPGNDIDWDNIDYSVLARILYMGRIYE